LIVTQPRGIMACMARIVFTQQLRRFTETPELSAPVATLRAALDAAFELNPRLRGYVLDEQGHMRGNVVAFVDGRRCTDRVRLADALAPDSEVYVLQALSGG
jgi:molybdopterin synthase sulfur carrier subunit